MCRGSGRLKRWANHVSLDQPVDGRRRYLVVSEADAEMVRGAWAVLEKVGEN